NTACLEAVIFIIFIFTFLLKNRQS
ncbi:uncharacterized protein METZ01_LOCUS440389, partial [marine metagenome]